MDETINKADFELLNVVISRNEVESLNIEPALSVLRRLMVSPGTALTYMESVNIVFFGYDHDPRELFEIPEVRDYVHKLDDQFPYWLFFLSKHYLGLQCLMFCKLLPFLTDEAKARHHPRQLEELLTNRWDHAMSAMAAFAGLTEQQEIDLAQRSMTYFINGRLTEDTDNS